MNIGASTYRVRGRRRCKYYSPRFNVSTVAKRDKLALIDPETGRLHGYVLSLREPRELAALANPTRIRVLMALARRPLYPREAAKMLGLQEQTVYYHVQALRRLGLLEEAGTLRMRGAYATRYRFPADGVAYLFGEPRGEAAGRPPSPLFDRVFEHSPVYMVLSSPEPHGPYRSRGRDHFLAAQLAYSLGAAYGPGRLRVVLDTDARERLEGAGLIVFGGPAVNMVTAAMNPDLPVYFDMSRDNAIVSRPSGKMYSDDNCGLLELAPNPYGGGLALIVAGKHLSGTRAALIALLERPLEAAEPNRYDPSVVAHVVEGIDGDGDGVVDSVEILE